jgi:uncharacterized protein YjcR
MIAQAQRDLARKLYIEDGWTYAQIAATLGCTEKTVWEWGKPGAGSWEEKRSAFVEAHGAMHAELYTLARKVMESIRRDIEEDREPNPTRVTLLKNLQSAMPKTKEYEEQMAQTAAEESKIKSGGLSPDKIAEIQEKVFGIKQ